MDQDIAEATVAHGRRAESHDAGLGSFCTFNYLCFVCHSAPRPPTHLRDGVGGWVGVVPHRPLECTPPTLIPTLISALCVCVPVSCFCVVCSWMFGLCRSVWCAVVFSALVSGRPRCGARRLRPVLARGRRSG
jgi:hypothetical protein